MSEFAGMSIQQRIRAMHQTIDRVDSLPASPAAVEMNAVEEEDDDDEYEEQAPRRTSVVDMWRKREATGPDAVPAPGRRKISVQQKQVAQGKISGVGREEKNETDSSPKMSVAQMIAQKSQQGQQVAPPVVSKAVPSRQAPVKKSEEADIYVFGDDSKNKPVASSTPTLPAKKISVADMIAQRSSTMGAAPPSARKTAVGSSVSTPVSTPGTSVADTIVQRSATRGVAHPSAIKHEATDMVIMDDDEERTPSTRKTSVSNRWTKRGLTTPTKPVVASRESDEDDEEDHAAEEVPTQRQSVADIWKARASPAATTSARTSAASTKPGLHSKPARDARSSKQTESPAASPVLTTPSKPVVTSTESFQDDEEDHAAEEVPTQRQSVADTWKTRASPAATTRARESAAIVKPDLHSKPAWATRSLKQTELSTASSALTTPSKPVVASTESFQDDEEDHAAEEVPTQRQSVADTWKTRASPAATTSARESAAVTKPGLHSKPAWATRSLKQTESSKAPLVQEPKIDDSKPAWTRKSLNRTVAVAPGAVVSPPPSNYTKLGRTQSSSSTPADSKPAWATRSLAPVTTTFSSPSPSKEHASADARPAWARKSLNRTASPALPASPSAAAKPVWARKSLRKTGVHDVSTEPEDDAQSIQSAPAVSSTKASDITSAQNEEPSKANTDSRSVGPDETRRSLATQWEGAVGKGDSPRESPKRRNPNRKKIAIDLSTKASVDSEDANDKPTKASVDSEGFSQEPAEATNERPVMMQENKMDTQRNKVGSPVARRLASNRSKVEQSRSPARIAFRPFEFEDPATNETTQPPAPTAFDPFESEEPVTNETTALDWPPANAPEHQPVEPNAQASPLRKHGNVRSPKSEDGPRSPPKYSVGGRPPSSDDFWKKVDKDTIDFNRAVASKKLTADAEFAADNNESGEKKNLRATATSPLIELAMQYKLTPNRDSSRGIPGSVFRASASTTTESIQKTHTGSDQRLGARSLSSLSRSQTKAAKLESSARARLESPVRAQSVQPLSRSETKAAKLESSARARLESSMRAQSVQPLSRSDTKAAKLESSAKARLESSVRAQSVQAATLPRFSRRRSSIAQKHLGSKPSLSISTAASSDLESVEGSRKLRAASSDPNSVEGSRKMWAASSDLESVEHPWAASPDLESVGDKENDATREDEPGQTISPTRSAMISHNEALSPKSAILSRSDTKKELQKRRNRMKGMDDDRSVTSASFCSELADSQSVVSQTSSVAATSDVPDLVLKDSPMKSTRVEIHYQAVPPDFSAEKIISRPDTLQPRGTSAEVVASSTKPVNAPEGNAFVSNLASVQTADLTDDFSRLTMANIADSGSANAPQSILSNQTGIGGAFSPYSVAAKPADTADPNYITDTLSPRTLNPNASNRVPHENEMDDLSPRTFIQKLSDQVPHDNEMDVLSPRTFSQKLSNRVRHKKELAERKARTLGGTRSDAGQPDSWSFFRAAGPTATRGTDSRSAVSSSSGASALAERASRVLQRRRAGLKATESPITEKEPTQAKLEAKADPFAASYGLVDRNRLELSPFDEGTVVKPIAIQKAAATERTEPRRPSSTKSASARSSKNSIRSSIARSGFVNRYKSSERFIDTIGNDIPMGLNSRQTVDEPVLNFSFNSENSMASSILAVSSDDDGSESFVQTRPTSAKSESTAGSLEIDKNFRDESSSNIFAMRNAYSAVSAADMVKDFKEELSVTLTGSYSLVKNMMTGSPTKNSCPDSCKIAGSIPTHSPYSDAEEVAIEVEYIGDESLLLLEEEEDFFDKRARANKEQRAPAGQSSSEVFL